MKFIRNIIQNIHISNKIYILGVIVILCLSSLNCSREYNRNVQHAFYFWQSNFNLSQKDIRYLNTLNVKKLYVRFFDVDWNPNIKTAVPVGDVKITTNNLQNVEIVPTVFITNRTLININDTLIQNLSDKIFKKITSKLSFFKDPNVKELQLDCDWTRTTKNKYFNLIKYIEKNAASQKYIITATIRLHQVKYFKLTGVPPVKRGMLMFYNMLPVSNIRTKNSIFEADAAKKYLINFNKYPLPLDVALPAFSWGVLFSGDKIKAIINDVTGKELLSNPGFKKIDNIHFRAIKNEYFKGRFIKKYDSIRLEEITPLVTETAAGLIAPQIKNDSLTVAIFHLNEELEKNYETQDIQNCYSAFR